MADATDIYFTAYKYSNMNIYCFILKFISQKMLLKCLYKKNGDTDKLIICHFQNKLCDDLLKEGNVFSIMANDTQLDQKHYSTSHNFCNYSILKHIGFYSILPEWFQPQFSSNVKSCYIWYFKRIPTSRIYMKNKNMNLNFNDPTSKAVAEGLLFIVYTDGMNRLLWLFLIIIMNSLTDDVKEIVS